MIKNRMLALLTALTLILAACGAGDTGANDGSGTATTAAEEMTDDSMAGEEMADEEMADECPPVEEMAEEEMTDGSMADDEMTDDSVADEGSG